MSPLPPSGRTLRLSLRANAFFSLLTGLLLLAFAPAIAAAVALWPDDPSLGATSLRELGGALLPFGLAAAYVSRLPPLRIGRWAAIISLLDLGWVVGSVLLFALAPSLFNATGWWGVAAIGLAVFGFFSGQIVGLGRLFRNHGDMPGQSHVVVTHTTAVPKAVAWSIVSDIAHYADYAPNIDFSRVIDNPAENAEKNDTPSMRTCGNSDGEWKETGTHWDEGSSYGFRVHTEPADYPYPFQHLQGHWAVEALTPEKTRIRMEFSLTMPGGFFGEVMVAALLAPQFGPVLETLLTRWDQAMKDAMP